MQTGQGVHSMRYVQNFIVELNFYLIARQKSKNEKIYIKQKVLKKNPKDLKNVNHWSWNGR